MKKKMQVFISSTFLDLEEERKIATNQILTSGHIPVGMELFVAENDAQLDVIYCCIDECDVLMVMLGGRYGSIDAKTNKSYVQLEYEYAKSKGIPIFALFLTDEFIERKINALGRNCINYAERLDELKREILDNKVIVHIDNVDQVNGAVSNALKRVMDDYGLEISGWIKNKPDILLRTYIESEIQKRGSEQVLDFSNAIKKYYQKIMKFDSIGEIFRKNLEIEFIDDDRIRVNLNHFRIYKYRKGRDFHIKFRATASQADTYTLTELKINGQNIAQEKCNLKKRKLNDTARFNWEIESNKIYYRKRIKHIDYSCSYECDVSEFYHAYTLSNPCHHCELYITLKNRADQYSVMVSSFSPGSNSFFEEETYRVTNAYSYHGSLPEWSFAGAGYVITLMKKN